MPRLSVNGVHLAYESRGKGPALVFLHGFMGSLTTWRDHLPAFESAYRVITVDLLGHGRSDSPADPERYRMEQCCDDLAVLFHKLGLDRLFLVGYSMGGRVAMSFAAAHPEQVSALVLESASPGLADPGERAARVVSDEVLAKQIDQEGLARFVSTWEAMPLFASQGNLPPAVRLRLRAERLANDPGGLANSLRGLGTGLQAPLWDRLPELAVSTLLIVGELDSKFRQIAQDVATKMPHAQLATVSSAGHTVHLEQGAAFDKLIQSFLAACR